ncbi:hypothetical protein P154DRAFT_578541 [Amniculicola lignicola CBS 123094]|uniref:WW domain-containing protein n=1 Tax=Amniculicola lignicola CBS 123094 TaxID=1392246 RepID=A0A6A5W792_9PLEO|nr:hypothetical protein P154DRAFT_578541 [Amniculicola lignicola CBS 123094]
MSFRHLLALAVLAGHAAPIPTVELSVSQSSTPTTLTETHIVTVTTLAPGVTLSPRQDPVNTWWQPTPWQSALEAPVSVPISQPMSTWVPVPSSVLMWSEPGTSWTEWVDPTTTISTPTTSSAAFPHTNGERSGDDSHVGIIVTCVILGGLVAFGIYGAARLMLYRRNISHKDTDTKADMMDLEAGEILQSNTGQDKPTLPPVTYTSTQLQSNVRFAEPTEYGRLDRRPTGYQSRRNREQPMHWDPDAGSDLHSERPQSGYSFGWDEQKFKWEQD